jgi:hypothetical protein
MSNMDYPIPSARELTPGEQQIETRIAVCAQHLMNAIVASGEKNGRVVAMGILRVLEDNPELALMVETYCANFKVRVVLRESRHLKTKGHV